MPELDAVRKANDKLGFNKALSHYRTVRRIHLWNQEVNRWKGNKPLEVNQENEWKAEARLRTKTLLYKVNDNEVSPGDSTSVYSPEVQIDVSGQGQLLQDDNGCEQREQDKSLGEAKALYEKALEASELKDRVEYARDRSPWIIRFQMMPELKKVKREEKKAWRLVFESDVRKVVENQEKGQEAPENFLEKVASLPDGPLALRLASDKLGNDSVLGWLNNKRNKTRKKFVEAVSKLWNSSNLVKHIEGHGEDFKKDKGHELKKSMARREEAWKRTKKLAGRVLK